MANKRQRKKSLKKLDQLAHLKLIEAIPVDSIPVIQLTEKEQFEAELQSIYNGNVTAVNKYLNGRCSTLFHCSRCDTEFWGKASHIIGKDSQKHICSMPYGDVNGERMASVGFRRKTKSKKGTLNIDQFNGWIKNDLTYKEIANKLKVNPNIIKDYFEAEGLL